MDEFKSFYKRVGGNKGNVCMYKARLDTYGRGCQHDCSYCYAKSILSFRGLWNAEEPAVADSEKIKRKIQRMPDSIVRLGGMTDCFMPQEEKYGVTYEAIKALNEAGKHYLIVTKSDLVANEKYMDVFDKDLAHIQMSTTFFPDEKAVSTERRIAAVEKLESNGFDVEVRLSPYIPQYVDYEVLNGIKCKKILVEFLRVNHWIKKWLPLDYSEYTYVHAGYQHLPLETKIQYLQKITGFEQVSVCDDVPEHKQYWAKSVNYNGAYCCNLRLPDDFKVI